MSDEELFERVFELSDLVRADCKARFDSFPVDLYDPVISEVTCGLLARQGTLLSELALSPGIWNPHVAPLFHRAMADVQITLGYILDADQENRAREFVLYGLGQEKLGIAQMEALLKEGGKSQVLEGQVKVRREWLQRQRFEYLTEVNLGSSTGLSTRQMAEQSGNKSLYDSSFTPFSAGVHSMWHHVGRYNVEMCRNLFHGGHLVGALPELSNSFTVVWFAAKDFRRTLLTVDKFMGTSDSQVLAWDHARCILNSLQDGSSLNESEGSE